MSWLKDKIFGKKPVQTSAGTSLESLEGAEELSQTNAMFCNGQLRNFLNRKETLKVTLMGSEVVSEVDIS